jgi:L-ascorbate metabolism protein UlaG (beta-lactamase superfamily)
MIKKSSVFFISFIFSSGLLFAQEKGGDKMKDVLSKIHWLGHATTRIDASKVIYIDPWKLKDNAKKADIILITHDHFDHCVPSDVKKIQKADTTIVTVKDCAGKLSGDVKIVKPGDKLNVKGIDIETVPAYNVNKDFHPKAKGWVGFIVTIDGVKIYQAGDTDMTEEMKQLKVDIALLPVGGTYTMTAGEAATAANIFKPKVVIPMHWGDIVGSKADAEAFRKAFTGETVILEPEQ